MMEALIFDFGDVFINLDHKGIFNGLKKQGITSIPPSYKKVAIDFEKGLLTREKFLKEVTQHTGISAHDFIPIWNAILKDFPAYRLEFLKELKKTNTYRLFLLSNTNEIHIDYVKEHVPFFEEFKSCFEGFYLSHEIKMRKPDSEIFTFVCEQNQLNPKNCFFIDDMPENTDSAAQIGIHTWNIQPQKEDVIDMFHLHQNLFTNG